MAWTLPDPNTLHITRGDTETGVILVSSGSAKLTMPNVPTGGRFGLRLPVRVRSGTQYVWERLETETLPYGATAAQVQAALVQLQGVQSGWVTASGGALPGTAVTLAFAKGMADFDPSWLEAFTDPDDPLTAGSNVFPAVDVSAVPLNLTGLTGTDIRMMLKDRLSDADASANISLDLDNGLTLSDAANGVVAWTLDGITWPTEWLGVREVRQAAEVQILHSSAYYTVWRGEAIITGDVVRTAA